MPRLSHFPFSVVVFPGDIVLTVLCSVRIPRARDFRLVFIYEVYAQLDHISRQSEIQYRDNDFDRVASVYEFAAHEEIEDVCDIDIHREREPREEEEEPFFIHINETHHEYDERRISVTLVHRWKKHKRENVEHACDEEDFILALHLEIKDRDKTDSQRDENIAPDRITEDKEGVGKRYPVSAE
jgi:hypothetical protein